MSSKKAKRKEKASKRRHCSYCNVTTATKLQFNVHCRTEAHLRMVMTDEEGNWKHRPPPRGVDDYKICPDEICRLGNRCTNAHSNEELKEWNLRLEYRQKKLLNASKICGKTFVENLHEKLSASRRPESVRTTSLLRFHKGLVTSDVH